MGEGAFYVERPADRELPDALRRGELCFVLATRQIGKSSLRLRAAKTLAAEGVGCVHLDLTGLGSETSTAETWYFGLTSEIADQLGLPPPDAFWDAHKGLGPVHAWSRYLEDEVLGSTGSRLGRGDLPRRDRRDAVAAVLAGRFLRGGAGVLQPARGEAGARTADVLPDGGGGAGGSDRGSDEDAVQHREGDPAGGLRARAEAAVLREGLEGLGKAPEALLDEVLAWTSGHPYMTLRICEDLAGAREALGVDEAVQGSRFLERGGRRTATCYTRRGGSRGRAEGACGGPGVADAAELYRGLLQGEEIAAEGSDPVQLALRLTGMAAEREGAGGRVLGVRNRIFEAVFDAAWVRKQEADRAIVEPLQRWLDEGRREDFLLGGAALQRRMRAWAQGREDLTGEEREFLEACARGE